MKLRLRDWAFFLICEGLFLLGLAVGIWGSSKYSPDPVAGLVFLGAALISLIIGASIFFHRHSKMLQSTSGLVSSPVSLDESFQAFLRFKEQPPLFQDPQFETHFMVLREGRQRIQLKPGSSCLIEHWQGPSIDIQHPKTRQRLSAREVVRINAPEASEVVIRKSEDFGGVEDSECRFLVHFISTAKSLE